MTRSGKGQGARGKGALGAAFIVVAAVASCVGDLGESGPGVEGKTANVQPVGDVPGLDSPTIIQNPAATRRLTVDELQASIGVVAGSDAADQPISWKVKIGNQTMDGLSDAAYGRTLGRPDYITITEEDPAPGPLYVKFVGDLSRDVCNDMVNADLERSGEATLWPHAPVDSTPTAAEIDENLEYLALRFWGFGADEVADVLEGLRAVHAAGVAADDPGDEIPPQAEGWRAVCVALIEDPSFHLH
jgi:hypothetical protein